MIRIISILLLTAATLLPATGCGDSPKPGADRVRIGTKNFTEQFILGEMMKQIIQAKTDLAVDLQGNLGGTMICHGALEKGEIDLYAEYTGTGLTAILKQKVIADPDAAFRAVAEGYDRQFDCTWLSSFGFNNTYAVTVRAADAESNGWKTVSDLAGASSGLKAGFTAEFIERPDGYPKLRELYGLAFGKVHDLDPGLMYEAVAHKEVDVICAFATDGRIAAYDLSPLADDKGAFPPYHAAPVVRTVVLKAHPGLGEALGLLAGKLDDAVMQELNFEVDEKKRTPSDVAREFLDSNHLLK
jgi:glycine betaine/choline ABC-type transport system substrate-binding protein